MQKQKRRQKWVLWVLASFVSPNKGRTQMPKPGLRTVKCPRDRNVFWKLMPMLIGLKENQAHFCPGSGGHAP